MPSSAFEVPPTRTAASPRENPTSFAHVILAPNEGGHKRYDKGWSKLNKFRTRDGRFLKLGRKHIVHEWLYYQLAKLLHLDYIFSGDRQFLVECHNMTAFKRQFKAPPEFKVPVYGMLSPYIALADANSPKLWTQTLACWDTNVIGMLELLVLLVVN